MDQYKTGAYSGRGQKPHLFGKFFFNLLGFFKKKSQIFPFIQKKLQPPLEKFLDMPLMQKSVSAKNGQKALTL